MTERIRKDTASMSEHAGRTFDGQLDDVFSFKAEVMLYIEHDWTDYNKIRTVGRRLAGQAKKWFFNKYGKQLVSLSYDLGTFDDFWKAFDEEFECEKEDLVRRAIRQLL